MSPSSAPTYSPGLIAACDDSVEARWLREEQAAGEHPLRLRLRRVEPERELRQVLAEAALHKRTALDVATRIVTEAAGGHNAAACFPFAMRHLAELKLCRAVPPGTTAGKDRLAHLNEAWRAIDAAVAAGAEIRLDARQSRSASKATSRILVDHREKLIEEDRLGPQVTGMTTTGA